MARQVETDDDATPVRSTRTRDREEAKEALAKEEKPKAGILMSLDDEDAEAEGGGGGGLFGSGPAHIEESMFAPFENFGGKIVWLVHYTRGEGKDKEHYEQAYSIGNGWSFKKGKSGAIISVAGRTTLMPGCNALEYFVKTLKAACKKAGIPKPNMGDPSFAEGMDVIVKRSIMEDRDFGDKGNDPKYKKRDASKGPKTILTIDEVVKAPWAEVEGEAPKKKAKAKPEPEEADEDDEDTDTASDAVTEEAVEAVIAVVAKGKVKVGDALEMALEKVLKGRKDAAAIIDLATSKRFLETEKGWVLSRDGKTIDAQD